MCVQEEVLEHFAELEAVQYVRQNPFASLTEIADALGVRESDAAWLLV